MKRKILTTSLLVGCLSAASVYGTSTLFALLPPPYMTVRVERVDVQDVCIGPGADYVVYFSEQSDSHSALITSVDGMRHYEDAPVRSEHCIDSALAWPDTATGFVRARRSSTGKLAAELVITEPSLESCRLILDLPLKVGNDCAPPNRGHFE